MIHRRDFIKLASAAMLTLCAAPATMLTALRRIDGGAPDALGFAHFAELLHATFDVWEPSGAAMPLQLVETRDASSRVGRENFSLMFRGALARPLAQGTYEFAHRRLGAFALFIVPMPVDGRHAYYEAVFNRV